MSLALDRRLARLVNTKTFKKLGYKKWHQLILRATVAESITELSNKDRAIIEKAERELLATTANIYLDIDGVLIHSRKNKAAIGIDYFLKSLHRLMMDGVDIYWLTTHCNGDASTAVKYLESYTKKPLSRAVLEQIKPTSWTVKTQGIDFSKPFLWLDDKPLGWADKVAMSKQGVIDNLVIVDLDKNPLALVIITLNLKKMLKKVAQKK